VTADMLYDYIDSFRPEEAEEKEEAATAIGKADEETGGLDEGL
jgi:hypothetical protein